MMIKNTIAIVLGMVSAFSVVAGPVNWTIDAELKPREGSIETERLVGSFTYDTDTAIVTNISLAIVDIDSGVELFSYGFARPRFGFSIVDFFESDPLISNLSGESRVPIGFNISSGLLNFSNSVGTFPRD